MVLEGLFPSAQLVAEVQRLQELEESFEEEWLLRALTFDVDEHERAGHVPFNNSAARILPFLLLGTVY